MKLIDDLKNFALRGNVIDLVVGFTVGAAFTTIAKSLVDDGFMPPVGVVMGKLDFKDMYVVLRGPETLEPGQQPASREGADHPHRQHLAHPPALVAVQRLADPIERVAQHRHQRQPLVGEREAPRQAPEQRHAEPPLEQGDLVAHRTLADAQLDRGTGEVEMPRRRLEGAQRVERKLGTFHRGCMN